MTELTNEEVLAAVRREVARRSSSDDPNVRPHDWDAGPMVLELNGETVSVAMQQVEDPFSGTIYIELWAHFSGDVSNRLSRLPASPQA